MNQYTAIVIFLVILVDPKATNLTAKLEEECLTVNYTLVDPGLCNVTYTLRLLEDMNATRAFVVNQDVTQSQSIDTPMEEEEDTEKSLSLSTHSKATPMVQPIEAESISQITSISQTISGESIQPTLSYRELSTTPTTVLQPTTDNTTQQNVLKSFQLSYNTTTYEYCFDNVTILDKFKNSLTISILGQYGNKTSLSATTKAVRILTPAPTTNPTTSPVPNTTTTTTTAVTTRSPNTTSQQTTPQPQNTTIQPTTAEKNTTRSPSVTTTKPKDPDEEDTCDDDKKKLVIAMFGGIIGAVAVIALIVI
uniref:Cnidarian restricted protein n=2 Tax=Clytia hemisphaerica TaxID=252671 RepID=A0A7M5UFB6_9CNID